MGSFKAVYRKVRDEPLKVQIAFWFIISLAVVLVSLLSFSIALEATLTGTLIVMGFLGFFAVLIWAVKQIATSNL